MAEASRLGAKDSFVPHSNQWRRASPPGISHETSMPSPKNIYYRNCPKSKVPPKVSHKTFGIHFNELLANFIIFLGYSYIKLNAESIHLVTIYCNIIFPNGIHFCIIFFIFGSFSDARQLKAITFNTLIHNIVGPEELMVCA